MPLNVPESFQINTLHTVIIERWSSPKAIFKIMTSSLCTHCVYCCMRGWVLINVYVEFEEEGAEIVLDYCICCECLSDSKIVFYIHVHVVALALVINNRLSGLRGINFYGLPL